MAYLIIHLHHTLPNTLVSLSIAAVTKLKQVWHFFLWPLFPFPPGHMPFSLLHISIIVSPHLPYRCPLYITTYSSLLPIILNFMSLAVYVIYGFDLTRCTNSFLALLLVSSLATRLPKVPTSIMTFPLPIPITLVMFALLRSSFSCLGSNLPFLDLLISPPSPHGSQSPLSTQPCLQHPGLRITPLN